MPDLAAVDKSYRKRKTMRVKIGNKILKTNLSESEVLEELDLLSDVSARAAKVEARTADGRSWRTVTIRWTDMGARLGA